MAFLQIRKARAAYIHYLEDVTIPQLLQALMNKQDLSITTPLAFSFLGFSVATLQGRVDNETQTRLMQLIPLVKVVARYEDGWFVTNEAKFTIQKVIQECGDASSTMAKLRQLDTKPASTVGDEDWSNIVTWVKEDVHAQVLFALGDGDIQKGARIVGLSKDLVPNVIARKPPSDRVNRSMANVEGRSDFESFATFCATNRRKN